MNVDQYLELAHFNLMQEFLTDEGGLLTDAMDAEPLYSARQTLAVTLAQDGIDPATQQEVIAAFRKAAEAEASRYADNHQHARAQDMAEDGPDE